MGIMIDFNEDSAADDEEIYESGGDERQLDYYEQYYPR